MPSEDGLQNRPIALSREQVPEYTSAPFTLPHPGVTPTMALTEPQKRHLRKLAHALKPVIIVGGGGVTAGVLQELDSTLEHHELLKVRVNAIDRDARRAMVEQLCAASRSEAVQLIGHIAVLYRRADKPRLQLP